ncbi:hypothetical protein CYLTODRAFT_417171 [Cylindrobasidium torrendii FP15055 ss-10]|uniref:F-box domain-containing protein n=1 Tax=Cylindrobasidium torrendii FP15055 ss-10 TaxID=1314674 RepID=A0A0D7BSS3_9AGAR|nr:hypothetical protein CYLTODRAFT_417171 [Cylindrobasidium torrendii FP15055 ss-10]
MHHYNQSRSILPAEVIQDGIIAALHDDHDALKACSLVSSSWTYTSQTHLFWRVRLQGTEWPKRPNGTLPVQRLADRIRETPYLAKMVRELELIEGDDFLTNRWLLESVPVLTTLLPQLVNLHTAHINARSLSWSVAASLEDSLRNLLQHTNLRHVSISSLIGLPSINRLFSLFGETHITRLELDNIQTNGPVDGAREYAPGSVKLPLEHISLSLAARDVLDLVEWLPDPLRVTDFSGLRRLRIGVVQPSEVRAASRLLEIAAGYNTLQEVEIQLDDLAPTDSRQAGGILPDVGHFRHVLLTLTPDCVHSQSWTSASVVARWWADILEQTKESVMEKLTLTFPRPDPCSLSPTHKMHWHALDKALTQGAVGASLKEVHTDFGTIHSDLREAALRDALPTLHKRGLIAC